MRFSQSLPPHPPPFPTRPRLIETRILNHSRLYVPRETEKMYSPILRMLYHSWKVGQPSVEQATIPNVFALATYVAVFLEILGFKVCTPFNGVHTVKCHLIFDDNG